MNMGQKIGSGFIVGLLIVTAVGIHAYMNTQRLLEANKMVVHTHEVIEKLEHIMSVLKDAETGQRGFVLTGEEKYLEPYTTAVSQIKLDVDMLTDLTRDNPTNQESLHQIRGLAAAKLAELQENIEVRRTAGLAATITAIRTDRGKNIMDELRNVSTVINNRERQLLLERSATAKIYADHTLWTMVLWIPLTLLVIAIATVILLGTARFSDTMAPASTPAKKWRNIVIRYVTALILAGAAVVLRIRLVDSFGPLPTFVTFYPAVVLVATLAGGGAGIFCTLLTALASVYWFLPPYERFAVDAPNDVIALGIFLCTNLFICLLSERLHRTRWAEALSVAQGQQLDELSKLNEELSQQSEELSQQAEELVGQNEELQAQSEEIQVLNIELTHREEMLQKLLEAARLGGQSEHTMLDEICTIAQTMFGDVAAAVLAFEKQENELLVCAQAGLYAKDANIDTLPAIGCFAELVIAENKTAALVDATLRPDITLIHPSTGGKPFRAVLSAPMQRAGQAFGAVSIFSNEQQDWTTEQFRLAEWLAAQCANTIESLRLQEDLRKAEQENKLLAGLLENSDQPFGVGYPDGRLGHTNRAFERLTGYSRDEQQTIDWVRVLTPEEWQKIEQTKLTELWQQGEPVRYEKEFIRKDGSRVPIELLVDLVKDEHSQPLYYYSFITDITERKRAATELARSAAIVDCSDDAILSKDVQGRIQTWNAGAARLFGYSAEEIIGQPLKLLIPLDKVQEEDQMMLSLINGQRIEHLETVRKTKDGRKIDVSINISPIRNKDGSIIGASKIIHDISARKRTYEALQKTAENLARSNKDLEQFAYVASHDLKEPLRMVTGFMSLLKDRYQGKLDAKADEYISYAADAATRMQRLIEDLLSYSREGRGATTEDADVSAVVTSVMQNLTVSIRESGAEITCDPLPTISANKLELVHVFQNLIGNSIKFKGEHQPKIHISAQRLEGHWLFTVRDNGIGIDPQFADRIFMIFQRLHTREQYPGTGIGLAICKKIVEQHGGRIWVDSEPSVGSTFHFTVPDQKQEP